MNKGSISLCKYKNIKLKPSIGGTKFFLSQQWIVYIYHGNCFIA